VKRKLAAGLLVSALFLWLAGRGIDWGDFREALRTTRYLYLVPAVIFTMLGHFSRALRWKYMMAPIKDCGIGSLWPATAIAFMVNNLLPARLGEFVRAFVIGRTERVSRSASFATIVYERVVDVFVLILLLWYCMMRISGPEWLSRSAGILIVFNVALFLLLWAMVRWRARFRSMLDRAIHPLPAGTKQRVHGSAGAFIDGLGVLTRPSSLFPIAALSVAVWGCALLAVYCCVLAFRMDVPPMASVFLIVLISLGSMIPSAPAFLGTMQYACVVGLGVYLVDRSHALAFSTVYHATQFFPITLAGLYYAWRAHLGLAELSGRNTA
jgi:hypothetical protein